MASFKGIYSAQGRLRLLPILLGSEIDRLIFKISTKTHDEDIDQPRALSIHSDFDFFASLPFDELHRGEEWRSQI